MPSNQSLPVHGSITIARTRYHPTASFTTVTVQQVKSQQRHKIDRVADKSGWIHEQGLMARKAEVRDREERSWRIKFFGCRRIISCLSTDLLRMRELRHYPATSLQQAKWYLQCLPAGAELLYLPRRIITITTDGVLLLSICRSSVYLDVDYSIAQGSFTPTLQLLQFYSQPLTLQVRRLNSAGRDDHSAQ